MHTKATLMLAGAAIPYYGLDRPELALASLLAGLWAVLAQPDLDQLDSGGYYGLHVLDKTAPFISKAWRLYWMPYARLIRHRAFISHFPFVGTLGRLVYGGWWFCWLFPRYYEAAGVFVALVVGSDVIHWIMDFRLWTVLGLFRQKG